MKPTRIFQVLDLAMEARNKGQIFNPLFAGAAGVGKSQICQQWAKMQKEKNPNFGFIDLRIAYMEQPDFIGYPESQDDANGIRRTVHNLPEFWPTEGEGILLLEEPNRATTGMMQVLMQILTDRQVHKYKLPEGWIIASCINPDSAEYDVSAMDTALKNRFIGFEIEYDHNAFVEYMNKKDWCPNIQAFVKSGVWIYKDAAQIGKDGTYISPRNWEQLNAAHLAGAQNDKPMHSTICRAILGKDIGNEFYKFVHDDAPVTAIDLLKSKTKALKKLKEQANPEHYAGDKISVTVESIIKNYGGRTPKEGEISEDLMVEVAKTISSDQALVLIKECGLRAHAGNITNFFKEFAERYPDLLGVLKANIKLSGGK